MRTIEWQPLPHQLGTIGSESSTPVSQAVRTPAAAAETEESPGSAAKADRLIRHPFILFLAMMLQPAGAMMLSLGDRQGGGSISTGDREHD
ncbi:hypothetical protein [Chelativorans salis]|uniref:Uncharacterized protein n=1 Tax=Chelativorans salis TaxID=2978478 RepID=A0ABT2LKH8_9HYPH|nr:hypothetical protein [Chelativorans sp. EGI FJ00035]MCT7375023.1 hypothetical protein [Chelativorans sp. EGI FJ00035]